MKARLIRIGNSRGVRLPKPVIEGAGLQEDVEIQVRGNTVVIGPRKRPRVGWAEAAKRMRQAGDGKLLDPAIPTKFDEREWRWR
jgi:antitoxin MazE